MAEVAFREASPPNKGHFIEFSLRVTNIPPASSEALSQVTWKSIQPSKTRDLTDLKSCRGNVRAVGIQQRNWKECRDVASRCSGFWRPSRQEPRYSQPPHKEDFCAGQPKVLDTDWLGNHCDTIRDTSRMPLSPYGGHSLIWRKPSWLPDDRQTL